MWLVVPTKQCTCSTCVALRALITDDGHIITSAVPTASGWADIALPPITCRACGRVVPAEHLGDTVCRRCVEGGRAER
jgi:hypothetical protein